MSSLEWNSFTKKIFIKSSLEKLFWCFATTEGICSWFLKKAVYLRNGKEIDQKDFLEKDDTYTWYWHNWDGNEQGVIIESKPNEKLVFSFAGTCVVTITFEQIKDSILVSLTQSDIPEDDKSKLEIFYGCSNGWTFWLANLKSYLEHNILLNETKIDLKGFDLAGYEFVNM